MTRTRFAPSPTGYLHIGGARTALSCWLDARQSQGEFVLRVEDTDRVRSTDEAVETILEGMRWLELDWDEGPFFQTQRLDRYKAVIQQLLDEGKAYYCYCSKEALDENREKQRAAGEKPRYNGQCRNRKGPAPAGVNPVVRFKNPLDGQVIVKDLIRGAVVFDNAELDDLIIARSDGMPTYNLTVVVDDMDMNITRVIRGEDHLNNTPRQINLYQALGAELPEFAHLSMIHGDDGSKLSKRHGAVSVLQYRDEGYLPDAVINYLARLGWSHGDQEVFSREELIKYFDIAQVSKSASVFNHEKLLWLNHHYIMHGPIEKTQKHLAFLLAQTEVDLSQGPELQQVIPIFAERSKTLIEMASAIECLYQDFDEYEEKAAKKHLRPVALEPLQTLLATLSAVDWQPEALQACIEQTAENLGVGMGKVGMPLRVALVGHGQSPAINLVLFLLGREKAQARIEQAIAFVKKRAESV